MTRRRVVVTGLGCVSPVGNTVAESWDNLLAGRPEPSEADAADPERLAGTAALVALGIAAGADIVRVHEVGFMARVARLADAVVRRDQGSIPSLCS